MQRPEAETWRLLMRTSKDIGGNVPSMCFAQLHLPVLLLLLPAFFFFNTEAFLSGKVALFSSLVTLLVRMIIRDATESRVNFERALQDMEISKSEIPAISLQQWFKATFLPLLPYFHIIPGVSFLPSRLRVIRAITFHETDDKTQLRMDVLYRSSLNFEKTPPRFVLYIHGGGWISGYRQIQSVPLQVYLAMEAGFIVCTVDYRLCPGVSVMEQIKDVKNALIFIKTKLQIEELGLLPASRNVVVVGESAGSHLSMMVALTQNQPEWQPDNVEADTSVIGCLDLFGFHDMCDSENHFSRRDGGRMREFISGVVAQKRHIEDRDQFESISPLALIDSNNSWCNKVCPPQFLGVHGTNDIIIPVQDARMFYDRLRLARRRWNSSIKDGYCELEGVPHGFNMFLSPNTFFLNSAAHSFFDNCFDRVESGTSLT